MRSKKGSPIAEKTGGTQRAYWMPGNETDKGGRNKKGRRPKAIKKV